MRFGSFVEFSMPDGSSPAEAYSHAFNHVDMAEELGLDVICLAEFHFTPNRVISSPMTVGAAIAGRTKRITIGTSVLVLPLSNPLRVAEEGATLDHVSDGRFEFGVGRSGFQTAYQGYGIPYSESRDRFREALDVITMAWTNDRFSYSGEYYSYEDVCVIPKPVQTPHPPIRIAATTNETFPVNGKLGYPLLIGLRTVPLEGVTEQVASYKRAYKEAKHEAPMDVSLRIPVYVAEDREAALTEPEESFMRQFRRLQRRLAEEGAQSVGSPNEQRTERAAGIASMDWEDVQREKVAVGTPEMVVEQLSKLREALHLTEVVAEFNAGELIPQEHIERSLRLFCEKVIPELR